MIVHLPPRTHWSLLFLGHLQTHALTEPVTYVTRLLFCDLNIPALIFSTTHVYTGQRVHPPTDPRALYLPFGIFFWVFSHSFAVSNFLISRCINISLYT